MFKYRYAHVGILALLVLQSVCERQDEALDGDESGRDEEPNQRLVETAGEDTPVDITMNDEKPEGVTEMPQVEARLATKDQPAGATADPPGEPQEPRTSGQKKAESYVDDNPEGEIKDEVPSNPDADKEELSEIAAVDRQLFENMHEKIHVPESLNMPIVVGDNDDQPEGDWALFSNLSLAEQEAKLNKSSLSILLHSEDFKKEGNYSDDNIKVGMLEDGTQPPYIPKLPQELIAIDELSPAAVAESEGDNKSAVNATMVVDGNNDATKGLAQKIQAYNDKSKPRNALMAIGGKARGLMRKLAGGATPVYNKSILSIFFTTIGMRTMENLLNL